MKESMKNISLRDWFAGMAMQGMLAGNACNTNGDRGSYAIHAYAWADAMILMAEEPSIYHELLGVTLRSETIIGDPDAVVEVDVAIER